MDRELSLVLSSVAIRAIGFGVFSPGFLNSASCEHILGSSLSSIFSISLSRWSFLTNLASCPSSRLLSWVPMTELESSTFAYEQILLFGVRHIEPLRFNSCRLHFEQPRVEGRHVIKEPHFSRFPVLVCKSLWECINHSFNLRQPLS
jgi:hypothetical protein